MESIHDVPLSKDLAGPDHQGIYIVGTDNLGDYCNDLDCCPGGARFQGIPDPDDVVSGDEDRWFCDHGISYKDECKKCDEEWANVADEWGGWEGYGMNKDDIIEGEVVVSVCDHNIDLGEPKFGVCEECDKEAKNTKTMAANSIWRVIDEKNYKYDAEKKEWVRSVVTTTPSKSWTPSKPLCKHYMQEFALENGLIVHASADRDAPANWKRNIADVPDLGVYLYSGWVRDELYATPGLEVPWGIAASWPMAWLDWPDFSIPDDPDDALIAAQWILDNLAAGKRVETGCMGGHGRTGTMLALLLVLQGVKPGTAIERVRTTYCDEAIEGNKQIDLIVYAYESAHGKNWKKSKAERKRVEDARPVIKPSTTPYKPTGNTAEQNTTKCIHGKLMTEPCVACDKLYT